MEKPNQFRVLIVGGGIAGLTLANSLQHAGIDYLLLESRTEIAPNVGASIGLAPNGSRILDQLGCYEDIENSTEPFDSAGYHAADGSYLLPRYDGFQLLRARTYYPILFFDRHRLLQILSEHIWDHNKILLDKCLSRVEEVDGKVVATCKDGTFYCGDIIVGADGVYSKTRQEMWRIAKTQEPGRIPDNVQDTMIAEYRCLFGISAPTPGLLPRAYDVTFSRDVSTMTITAKGGRVYWFLFEKMPQTYRMGEIPRFNKQDKDEMARKYSYIPIYPGGTVKFGDIWRNCERATLVALEEADFEHWTWGRFACLGDSAHKMTPNAGAGGMSGIESAAALANSIKSLVNKQDHGTLPSYGDIRNALAEYQQERKLRASATVEKSNYLTRIQAIKGTKEKLIAHWVFPYGGDYPINEGCWTWLGSTMLNFLPPPPKSLLGTMPFNRNQGLGNEESIMRRAIIAAPLLAMSVQCFINTSSQSLATMSYGSISSSQVPTFLADFGLVYAILLIESSRRANALSLARLPILFGMASLCKVGAVMPIYFFIHYVFTPIEAFSMLDKRLTDMRYTASVLPVMILIYYIPSLLARYAPDPTLRHIGEWIYNSFPLWIGLGQFLLAHTPLVPNTVQHDRINNVTRDVPTIRWTISLMAAVSGLVWLGTVLRTSFSLGHTIIPYLGEVEALKYNYICFTASSLIWIVLLFWDLKAAGMVRQSWLTVVGLLCCAAAVFGPGAAAAAGWLWREEVIATKRHKDALIRS
ncbi:uncharacterized protein K452DRAFT_306590 [Aplosporella prunicola CBS 121167]|uniref:FAD-binding domain-containing protein n=1 Tax=Aplosporella prunicola CBS 121167 TaxID=1176127 RepID=A0A6A6BL43_9PEZI|nr:uncharacterized protein K452DRAFT_306590 [Aplosporella prunicola CBS 121167]KAF2144829.1 hypothetical protein K452DRAFT_306590 [Aplosporella prunicola CBS 121167]